MFTKKLLTIIFFALFALLSIISETKAQTAATFVTGLNAPTKIIYAHRRGYFLVSEGGNAQPNSGRISIVTNEGFRSTLIEGLPSGLAPPNNEPIGPSALWLDGNTLYIAIGGGNEVLAGPAPGSEIPNPNPNSPLFSSVLKLNLPSNRFEFDSLSGAAGSMYQIQSADHTKLANGETLTLGSRRNRATLQMVANFPDYTPNPRPDVPNNVRNSNPFGLVGFGNKLYVADAAQNNIRTISLENGQVETFFTYPPRRNPLPGPPFVEAVPDSLRLFGNSLLVSFLTGFPFPAGVADIRRIDLESGAESQFIGGLTTAIDVLPVANGFCHSFYTLEISTSLTTRAPGRLQRFTSPGGPPTLISNNLISPTSMALHPPSGDLLVTEIFPGRITRISNIPQ